MAQFNLEEFTRRLIVESLFFDEEYGALSNLSLIDPNTRRERFLASIDPEDGSFVIEEATEWEESEPTGDDEITFMLAVDSTDYGQYETAEEVSAELLKLAQEHNLLPSLALLFDDEEAA